MEAYVLDWLNLLLRWLHFIAGVAWIGASFYFVWLDNHLLTPTDPDDDAKGVGGELCGVLSSCPGLSRPGITHPPIATCS